MFLFTDDPPRDYAQWDADRHRKLSRRPKCNDCDEYIESDHYFEVEGDLLCLDCMNDRYRKSTDDYMDDCMD